MIGNVSSFLSGISFDLWSILDCSWREQGKDLVSFLGMWTSSFTSIHVEEVVPSLQYVHGTYVNKIVEGMLLCSFLGSPVFLRVRFFMLRSSSLGQDSMVGVLKPCIEMLIHSSSVQDCYIRPWLQVFRVFIWILRLQFSSVIMNIISLTLKIIWIIHTF